LTTQILDFFARIFENKKTEAEVILLLDPETKEWSLFIPYQKVSSAGVNSAFDPASVPEGKVIAGSMHSHCDFSPFHSGTDTADASDMDGIHYTIGYVNTEPRWVAMIMINGEQWDQNPLDFAESGDSSAEAPKEWDDFVFATGDTIPDDVKEIFTKFGARQGFVYKAPAQTTQPQQYGAWQNGNTRSYESNWNSQMPWGWEGWDDNDWDEYIERRYPDKKKNDPKPKHISDESYKSREKYTELLRSSQLNSSHWEDYLNDDIIDSIMQSGLFTDDDFDKAAANPGNAQDINYWRTEFMIKAGQLQLIFGKLGMVMDYSIVSKKPEDRRQDIVMDGDFLDITDLLPDDTKPSKRGEDLADELRAQGWEIKQVNEDGSVEVDMSTALNGE
jgi:proteasome lid subunit RPN8/RPN11